jgi:5-hydroxyisourate hydrolase-like protein (transthyretin family)
VACPTAQASATTGDITGTVRNASGYPLNKMCATAYRWNGSGWAYVTYADTVIDGTYDISGLATGAYRVEFYDYWVGGYLRQYYNNEWSIDVADDVSVTAGQTTSGIDAVMTMPGHITGTVTNASGDRLAGVMVTAYRPNGYGGWVSVRIITTGSDGTYDLSGLATAGYRVEFWDGRDGYLDQFYNNKPTIDAADDVSVIAGQTTSGIDAVLAISDTTPPTTTSSGAANGKWYRAAVTVSFTAADDAGGSGVDYTQYKLDAADWATGTSVDVSTQGPHTLLYRSVDKAGNAEAQKSLPFGVDSRKPTTRAPYAATAYRGRTATLRYRIVDPQPGSPTATVTIKVRNRAGNLVRTLGPAVRAVNSLLPWRFTVPRTWRTGTYRFYVYAKDKAGNTQTLPVGSNKLVVK